jgi:hypothetical protein
MRAGKIISHLRRGKGKTGVHALTVARPGPIGDTGVEKHADMYVDVFPYVSLKGPNVDRLMPRRSNTMRTHDESHIQSHTRGRHTGSATAMAGDGIVPAAKHDKDYGHGR